MDPQSVFMGNNIFKKLTEKYPFITLCVYANVEYIGVIQNRDEIVTTIYDFGVIQNQTDKLIFLELAGGQHSLLVCCMMYHNFFI